MKHLQEYRAATSCREILETIRHRASQRWRIMDVCGGQTHNLLKHGIEAELEENLELIHGPGCPVCVTPAEVIDEAQQLALLPEVTVMTFGDMLRVPGTARSLSDVRAEGGAVQTVYSPLEAVTYAKAHAEETIVFFAVGFETTAPATALAVMQAAQLELTNFCLLTSHVRVLPAMRLLLQQSGSQIDGFLAAGHVCTITGFQEYDQLARDYGVPVVITGFEPLDLLAGLSTCVDLLEQNCVKVVNRYPRSVEEAGNVAAQRILQQVYCIADQPWRGLGKISEGGLVLKPEWAAYDARQRFSLPENSSEYQSTECLSHEILQGRLKPTDCPHFGTRCHPGHPLGAPMVSSEGACAAYYQYHQPEIVSLSSSPQA